MREVTVYVLVIDTDTPDIYEGVRISAHGTREEAVADLTDFIAETCLGDEEEPKFLLSVRAALACGDHVEAARLVSADIRYWRIDELSFAVQA